MMAEMDKGFNSLTTNFGEEIVRDGKRLFTEHKNDKTFVHGKFYRRQYLIDYNIRFCDKLTVHEDSYFNMKEQILPHMHLIDSVIKACKNVDVTPEIIPIRGGTDGARLSFMGLPCPNLGTGGYGFHGPFEHISVEGMETAVKILLEILSNPVDR